MQMGILYKRQLHTERRITHLLTQLVDKHLHLYLAKCDAAIRKFEMD